MLIYYTEVSLEQGFEVLTKEKPDRLVRGVHVNPPSGKLLFEHLWDNGHMLRCWECNRLANCWIVEKGKNDRIGSPNLNLYSKGEDGSYMLMTRDHIIPRSYGGVDAVENLRMACSQCNSDRGNEINQLDMEFLRAHPELLKLSKRKLKLAEDATFVPNTAVINELQMKALAKITKLVNAKAANKKLTNLERAVARCKTPEEAAELLARRKEKNKRANARKKANIIAKRKERRELKNAADARAQAAA
jgi:hypothetical protein